MCFYSGVPNNNYFINSTRVNFYGETFKFYRFTFRFNDFMINSYIITLMRRGGVHPDFFCET